MLNEEGYLLAAGKVLEYAFCGSRGSSGPVILLLHEGLGCCAMWKDFPRQLASACKLPVLSYSRAGYGRSEAAGLPWPVSYMHDEALVTLPAFLDAAGTAQVILVGHSDGASIASIYAGSPMGADIRGLVLMAPHFFVEDISLKSIIAARKLYDQGDLRRGLEKYHGLNTDEAFNGWNGAWLNPEFREWNITSCLAAIKAPVLGLQGADDEYGTSAQLEAMKQHCTAAVETHMLARCGHSPHRDQPEMSLKVIAKFVAQL
ncbi:MAG: alpha/beta hydrolase [Rhizobiales bacterium]|nr:alpha/beta hydrolase [Hyphomicrobiales bacterium]